MISNKEAASILVKEGYLESKEAEYALKESLRRDRDLLDILISFGYISRDLYREALAEYYKVASYVPNTTTVDMKVFGLLGEEIAKQTKSVAVKKDSSDSILVATNNPADTVNTKVIAEHIGSKIKSLYALPDDINDLLERYRPKLKTQIENLEDSNEGAVQLLNILLEEAIQKRASDVHIEPQENDIIVRFRIDGVMHVISKVSKEYLDPLSTRIKILAKLRTDEHRTFQDGSIRFRIDGASYDTRVSIAPTIRGEKITFRVLSEKIRQFTLSDLGLASHLEKRVQELIKRPFGMILSTGPTGSGKTTTLYAILRALNQPETNITTIEDPIEYRIDGVNQIQVNGLAKITFANGLRSIVRQDPDIILVGEIRDSETADVSVNAALTGHLLLSTIHTNDAPTTFPRLTEMGVEPFLISSTLIASISQRLVRKLCNNCLTLKDYARVELVKVLGQANADKLGSDASIRLPHSKGCQSCGNTGYLGRIGIFEILEVTPKIHDLIIKQADAEEIYRAARSEGFMTMFEDGIDKVQRGLTTIEEVLRVALPEKQGAITQIPSTPQIAKPKPTEKSAMIPKTIKLNAKKSSTTKTKKK